MSNKFNRSLLDANISIASSDDVLEDAIYPYMKSGAGEYINGLNNIILRQPDLLNITSRFASEGANKNNEVFLRSTLCKIWETPRHKFVDFEHDPNGTNWVGTEFEGKNPDKYHIIGHIWDSALATQDGEKIDREDIKIAEDGKAFDIKSPLRKEKLDVLVSWILYKWEFEEIADLIVEEFLTEKTKTFGVSMEVLYSDYKYRIGDFDVNEDFDYDATKDGKLEFRKGTKQAEILEDYWKKKRKWNGQTVYRILGGEIFFSGMGVVRNRGEERAINLSVASSVGDYLEKAAASNREIDSLIMSVAAMSDKSGYSCSIEGDGRPSCDCFQGAIDMQLDDLEKGISALSETIKSMAIKKRKDVNPKEGQKKYGDVKYADPKNKKYPIDTEAHIRAAWNYINMPKNAAKYSPKDVKTIKSRIASAWKKKIQKDGPPSASKAGLSFGCAICGDYDDDQDFYVSDQHYEEHMDQIGNNLVRANQKLVELYENNLDNDLSKEEVLEYLEEIEHMLYESESFIQKISQKHT